MTTAVIQRGDLQPTRCAICDTLDGASELYPANFDYSAFTPKVFSARRIPDRIHYRLVRCNSCGLIRSDPVLKTDKLETLYAESAFTYDDEVANLKRTYGRYLSQSVAQLDGEKRRLLEIGCGNGFFLEEALERGFAEVRGVEPSKAATSGASDKVSGQIVCDTMRAGLFTAGEFDMVCMFQVLDHLPRPGELLNECLRVLRPGGLMLCLNHNSQSISARVLGERSPIIDVEHTYLYSPVTMRRILSDHGFDVLTVTQVRNTYSVRYLLQLMPISRAIKQSLLTILKGTRLGGFRLSVPLGNLCAVARKPIK